METSTCTLHLLWPVQPYYYICLFFLCIGYVCINYHLLSFHKKTAHLIQTNCFNNLFYAFCNLNFAVIGAMALQISKHAAAPKAASAIPLVVTIPNNIAINALYATPTVSA